MGVSYLQLFDLRPLNPSKVAKNTNPHFFWDTLYIIIIVILLSYNISSNSTSSFLLTFFYFWGKSTFFLTFCFCCNFFAVKFFTSERNSPFNFQFLFLNCFLLTVSLNPKLSIKLWRGRLYGQRKICSDPASRTHC